MNTKTESMTPLANWLDIKVGQFVRSRRNGKPRKVLDVGGGYVVLEKLRSGKNPYEPNTCYAVCDRHFFII